MKTSGRAIVVSVLTYRRPDDLARLFRGLAEIDRPQGWTVRFLVVDNDPEGSARPVVASARTNVAEDIAYVLEPNPGIPAARNRAVDEAAALGGRLLAFIDDDETPDQAWLSELVSHYERTRATLIGGPYLIANPDKSITRWQRFLVRSIQSRSRLMAANIARLHAQGKFVVVSSGNWLADLSWISEHGVSFDPDYRVLEAAMSASNWQS